MDTRTKIATTLAEALEAAGPDPLVVSGYFDPLTADHARRLCELAARGKPIVVIVESPPDPLLDARARAELVAGMAVVRSVIIHEPGMPGIAGSFEIARDHDRDLHIRDVLMDHVRRRHA